MDPETVAAVAARSKGRCEYPGCNRQGVHLHHRKLRRHGDHSAENIMLLCVECHRHVHDEPAESYANGTMVKSFDDPSSVPW